MNESLFDILDAYKKDIIILNDNIEEIMKYINKLLIDNKTLLEINENNQRSIKLNEVRLNKLELLITKLQGNLPKIRSFDYLPVPKVTSESKIK